MFLARQKGFSLVELMIAILLASITAVVVLNVLTSYQARSNTMTGRNEAQINAAVGLYNIEKEVRMAGAGLTTASGPLCPQGVNIAWNGSATSDGASNGAPLLPVRIIDGDTGPDSVEIIRSDSDFGAAPTRLIAGMAGSTAQLSVDGKASLKSGDLVMVGSSDGTRLCTLMQLSEDPEANGSGWLLSHASGVDAPYNAADPAATFTTAVNYQVRDFVMNMGTYGVRRFGIVCNDGGAPAATNNCDLAWWNPLDLGATPTLAAVSSTSSQIVDLQAQYGVAPAGSEVVNEWVDATGSWAAPTLADQNRIRAVRISLIARGAREGNEVAPASVVLWQNDDGTDFAHGFSTAEQRFRYQVLTVVVPLINTIWAGT